MKALKRIALLLVGMGVAGLEAAEPAPDEKRLSPIFAPASVSKQTLPARISAVPTRVSRQLTDLIRHEVAAAAPTVSDPPAQPPAESGSDTLQLEKMTVKGQRIVEPPLRESPLEKFTRTGHLWEFSDTKRVMIGPRGDKVGVMFSFDW